MEIKRYLKAFWLMAKMVILPDLVQPSAAILFIIGKVARFGFYFIFLYSTVSGIENFAGYNTVEVIWFFLVFNLIDILIQFLFRGVYHFRPLVISGNFDLELLKPLPSFFRPLFGHIDIMDFITLVPLSGFMVWYVFYHNLADGPISVIYFILLILASLLIGFAFHLFISSICILTTEIDHLVWVYRDVTAMGRFPTDIYQGFVRFLVVFVIPVVLLITFPAKAMLGLISPLQVALSVAVSLILAGLALKFWYWSLKRYTSASS
jgi:ABC-2 type transport system permease protein